LHETYGFQVATYAPSGASSLLGTSLRFGNLVESGENGITVAVLLPVRKSVICVIRFVALMLWSAISTGWYRRMLSRRWEIVDVDVDADVEVDGRSDNRKEIYTKRGGISPPS